MIRVLAEGADEKARLGGAKSGVYEAEVGSWLSVRSWCPLGTLFSHKHLVDALGRPFGVGDGSYSVQVQVHYVASCKDTGN